jgi:HK97 family phage prohead protease
MQQTRDFSFLKVKALDESSGTFTGYASTYGGPPDLQGDIIEPGAYKQAIVSQGNGYPLLWAHQQSEPLGLAKVSDSAAGLVVNGSMVMADPAAQRAYAHLKAGSIKGLSIGFNLPPESSGKVTYGADGTRTIREIKLFEISLVAIPANPAAQVVSVKSLSQVERLLSGIKHGDVTSDMALASQLRSIDRALKSLLRKDALCECDCPECLEGDCEDCSDLDCNDPNCEGSMKAAKAAEELAMLKSFATSLKSIAGGR